MGAVKEIKAFFDVGVGGDERSERAAKKIGQGGQRFGVEGIGDGYCDACARVGQRQNAIEFEECRFEFVGVERLGGEVELRNEGHAAIVREDLGHGGVGEEAKSLKDEVEAFARLLLGALGPLDGEVFQDGVCT